MQKRTLRITNEHLLIFLAFGLALAVRLARLGGGPLSDFEASSAIQSWQLVEGQTYQIGSNPGYVSLTALIFYLLGNNNGLARLWPALAGSMVVLGPWGFRRWLGSGASLVLAFGLAFDAGMVAISRLAGGPMLAMGFLLLAALFVVARKPVWAGAFGGLALVSGPGIVTGLLGMFVAYGLGRLVGLNVIAQTTPELNADGERLVWSRNDSRTFALVGVSTGVLTSTLFFLFPQGVGAWGNLFASYWTGWFQPSGIPFGRLIAAVVVYQPLALVFGGIAAVRGWRQGDYLLRWLSLWFLVALTIVVIYPGRQVYDAVWSLLPLWALAATEIWRFFKKPDFPLAAASQAGTVFILLTIFGLISLNIIPGEMSWLVLVALPLLIVAMTILVGMGWSWQASLQGLAWGTGLCLGLFSLASMVGASQNRPNSATELWQPLPGVGQVDLLVDSLKELALIQNGREDWIDILSSVESPALAWALRDFSGVQQVSMVGSQVLTTVIITPTGRGSQEQGEQTGLSQEMAYRGQDFIWASYPGWQGAIPPDWWRWVTTRVAPTQAEKIILWARADLFPEETQVDPSMSPEEGVNEELRSEPIE